MHLLKTLCAIPAPSGNESTLKNYILNYINLNIQDFKIKPTIIKDGIQDCLILKFGTPKTAIFAHLDSVGFTVRYGKELIKIGGPKTYDGIDLVGKDSLGNIEAELYNYEDEDSKSKLDIYYVKKTCFF